MPRTLLSAHELVRAHGSRTVLASVSLTVDDATRIALVGRNGSGKSTLLRLLAGVEPPDGGRVVRARGAAVLHLPQLDAVAGGADPVRAAAGRSDSVRAAVGRSDSVRAAVGRGDPVRAVLHERLGVAGAAARMDAFAGRLGEGAEAVDAHAAALEEWLARGGADVDARLDRAAVDAGLAPALLDRSVVALSGGQRARAMLAAITVARADVLLLDEPANHLDADGLARLRVLLAARRGGLVLVAHDRTLLADVSDRVAELDAHDGTLTEFAGGWAAYEAERARARAHATEAHERAVTERDRLLALETAARRRAVNGQRNARSENDRSLRHLYEQSAQAGSDGMAARYARRAARIEIPDRPWREKPAHLPSTAIPSRAGVVAALRGAVLVRGGFVLGPLDLEVRDGERILLAGPNGSGKSTVLAALAGHLEPRSGDARRVAGAIAEVAQERGSLLAGGDARDTVAAVRAHTGLPEREARAALAAMGLDQDLVARPPATLSPGERTRAELAAATAAGARLLLLDEPTNHLDIDALQALEAALDGWPGALVVATHDTRLRDNLRLERVVAL